MGAPRYTHLLRGRDLSNVAYFYAENDQQVGALQAEEVQFLETHQAKVFKDDRGHTKTWQRFIDEYRKGSIHF